MICDGIISCNVYSGIAGASYIPIVQTALPRLLGAAAPPGANARENRKQCLKVITRFLHTITWLIALISREVELIYTLGSKIVA